MQLLLPLSASLTWDTFWWNTKKKSYLFKKKNDYTVGLKRSDMTEFRETFKLKTCLKYKTKPRCSVANCPNEALMPVSPQ